MSLDINRLIEINNSRYFKTSRILSTLFIFLGFFFLTIQPDINNMKANFLFLIFFILALPSVVLSSILTINKIKQNYAGRLVFRLLIGVMTILSGAVALALARKSIHSAMSLDPSFFPVTTTIISLVYLLPSWIVVLAITIFIISLLGFVIFFFASLVRKPKLLPGLSDTVSVGMGMGGLIFFSLTLSSSIMNYAWYSEKHQFLYKAIQSVVVMADFYNGNECQNTNINQMFCYVGENKIAVCDKDKPSEGLHFTIRKCR